MTKLHLNDFAGHAFTLRLAEGLRRRGLDTAYAYCSTNLSPHADFAAATVPVVAVRSGSSFDKYRPARRAIAELRYGIGSAVSLVRHRPATLVANNMPLLSLAVLWAAARLTRTRFVIWLQDIQSGLAAGVLGSGSRLARLAHGLERFLLRRGDRVIAISDELADEVERWGVRRSRLSVLENWPALDSLPERPKSNPWSQRHGLEDRPVVLYSGTLARKHAPELLLTLADEIPAAQIVVVSEGAGIEWLDEQQRAHPRRNLTLLPYAPFGELPDVLGSADVLVALLTRDASKYSVPSKVLSYLCAGRPIVASIPIDNAAARLVSERANAGVVVEPGDTDSFVRAVKELLDDPARAAELGRNGRSFAERTYTEDLIIERFLEAAGIERPDGAGAQ